ncbi:MAG: hypothetical protein AABZ39_10635 [Spirochaetota bacterium]
MDAERYAVPRVNLNEILFDAAIAVGTALTVLYGRGSVTVDTSFIEGTRLTAYLLVSFCLPFYMSRMFSRYEAVKSVLVKRIIVGVYVVTAIMTFMSATGTMIFDAERTDHVSMFIVCMAGVLLIMGGITGFITIPQKNDTKKSEDKGAVGIVIVGLILTTAFMFYLMIFKPFLPASMKYLDGFYVIAAFIAAPLAGVIFMVILLNLKSLLIRVRLYGSLAKFMQFLFPVMIAGSLLLFNNSMLALIGRFLDLGHASPLSIVIALIITGVIPFRLALLFAPPVRAANALTGSAVLVCCMLCLFLR